MISTKAPEVDIQQRFSNGFKNIVLAVTKERRPKRSTMSPPSPGRESRV